MLSNYELCIVGEKCVLVPYRPEHVETYHSWMKDPEMLEATGSEPLSMEEEIAMQVSWRDDPKKCTFIVLAKKDCTFLENNNKELLTMELQDYSFVERNLNAMVGDVNLFLSEMEHDEDHNDEDHNDDAHHPTTTTSSQSSNHDDDGSTILMQAELDIMIASSNHRGHGIGQEACLLMMMYGAQQYNIQRFFCKINKSNIASMTLFERKLGFRQVCFVQVFQQYELERKQEESGEISMVESLKKDLLMKTSNVNLISFQCPLYKF